MYAPTISEPVSIAQRKSKTKKLQEATLLHVEAVLRRHEEHVDMQNQPRAYAKALGELSLAATTPWLERTQWLSTYRDVRRDILKALATIPVDRSTGKL